MPVVFHHGSPSSRIEAALFAEAAGRCGIRLIAFDRPGIGRSDYRVRWTYRTVADDVAALADHLGLGRFGVLGWSGGGPPALACAFALKHRLTAVTVVAAAPFGGIERHRVRGHPDPVKRLVAHCAWKFPGAMDWLVWPLGHFVRGLPRRFMNTYRIKLCATDRRVLDEAGCRAVVEANLQEAFRQGVQGYAHDLDRLFSRWDFDPGGIELPVRIWQGTDDELVRADLEQALAAAIPTAELRLFEGEGHYLLVPRADELFGLFREPSAGA